jgi:predicted SAM-dependent methyltransferase
LKGWINVDANLFTAKIDVWADLGQGLPFRSNSIDAFYSYHMIEHLPEKKIQGHIVEIARCLKPEGILRLGVPNADSALRRFLDGDNKWFPDWPISRKSAGGRLSNFLMCSGEHSSILTYCYLEELITNAGLSEITRCAPGVVTNFPALIDDTVLATESEDCPEYPHTLVVEAKKPRKQA